MLLDESKINSLLSLSPGERTDHVLYYLFAPHMLGYWTFLKPKVRGEEISDTMLIYGDVCILFEAKTRQKAGPTNERWIQARLKEAIEQLNTNAKRLSQGMIPEVRNKWRGIVQWASLGIKHYYGMVIILHESEPYDPRDLTADSFASSSIPVQVMSLQDFEQLMRFVNTPWDFIVYYELRKLFGEEFALPVHQEEGIYWGVIREWSRLTRTQTNKMSESDLAQDQEYVRTYSRVISQVSDMPQKEIEAVAASFLVDIAAGSLSRKADSDSAGKIVGNKDHAIFVSSMEAITELSRRRRQVYGSYWVSLAKKAQYTGCSAHKTAISPSRNRSYIMFASNGNECDESDFVKLCHIEMQSQGTDSCLGLMATDQNILDTHQSILVSLKRSGDTSAEIERVLDTKAVFIKRPNEEFAIVAGEK